MVISGAVPIEASISSATVASASGVVAGAAVGQNVVYSSNFNNTSSDALQKNTSGGRNDISDTSEDLGIVKSRINIAKGATRFTPLRSNGNRSQAGFEHVRDGHFNRPLANSRSVFSISEEKLKSILQRPDIVKSPVTPLEGGQYLRTVDTGEVVGNTALKFGGKETTYIDIFTDKAGNLITTYPVPGK